jgi:hypothetical protein
MGAQYVLPTRRTKVTFQEIRTQLLKLKNQPTPTNIHRAQQLIGSLQRMGISPRRVGLNLRALGLSPRQSQAARQP